MKTIIKKGLSKIYSMRHKGIDKELVDRNWDTVNEQIDDVKQALAAMNQELQNRITTVEQQLSSQQNGILTQQNAIDTRTESIFSQLEKQLEKLAFKIDALSAQTEASMAKQQMLQQQNNQKVSSDADNEGDMCHSISFDNFEIRKTGLRFDVTSTKREKKERIEFDWNLENSALSNDAIACALATFCGQSYTNVYFDLPITNKVKEQLISFTKAHWITNGILPEKTESTERNGIILNFSGGYDSLAAKALLPEDTRLVAMQFGGGFEREADFFKRFSPYTVSTNFRALRFDRESWTFMGSGAVLLAETLNAKYNVFGAILEASIYHFNAAERFVRDPNRQPFATGGLKDVKVTHGLTEVGTAMIVTHYYPEYVNASLKSLAAKGSEKLYRKQILTDIVRRKYNRDIAPIEFDVPNADKVAIPFGQNFPLDFLALYELKYAGIEIVKNTVKDIPEEAIELAQRLKLRFYERLYPTYLEGIPEELRQGYLERLHAAGVLEYDDQDWAEFQEVKKFLARWHKGITV